MRSQYGCRGGVGLAAKGASVDGRRIHLGQLSRTIHRTSPTAPITVERDSVEKADISTVIATSSYEQHGKRFSPNLNRRPAAIDL